MTVLQACLVLKEKFILFEVMVHKLIRLLDAINQSDLATLICFGWAFLNRMQSEIFPLKFGCTKTDLVTLSSNRATCVIVDDCERPPRLTVSWLQRKNRPPRQQIASELRVR